MQNESRTLTWVALGVILVVVIAVVGALVIARNNQTNTTITSSPTTTTTTRDNPTGADTTPQPSVTSRTFTLTAQNGSGQNGEVLLEEVGTQVRVTITLSNPSATPEPTHIHVGSCPTPGSVIFPLESVENGTSVTMLNTNLIDLAAQGSLAVNVHKSAAESGVYYACGDLDF